MPGSVELFRKFLNPVFIETGCGLGDGIQAALDAGFEKVISIELHDEPYNICSNRFAGNERVILIKGDSSYILWTLLPKIRKQITFWLDGHDEDSYPVLDELEAIKDHSIKTHTILVDDLRMFDLKKHGLDEGIIMYNILQINEDYNFYFEDGHIKNDILIAKI
jgi:hypothetical protein